MKAVIMAGGKGTRISSIASDIPKPLIPIEGKPVLQREIECLRDQGFTDLIITVSHLGQAIMDYFGDGSSFGVHIEYYFEKEPLGNAGALFKIKDKLSDDFLLLTADSLLDVDFKRFVEYHFKKGGLATLFTHPNSHPYDSSVLVADENGSVIKWLTKEDHRPEYYSNRVNAGLHILNKHLLDVDINSPKVDLDRQILKPLQGSGKLFVYDSPEYVKDMGTPDRFYSVCEDCRNGLPGKRNLSNKQKAIFIDRDLIVGSNDPFKLRPEMVNVIKKINRSEFLVIVTANNKNDYDVINMKIETALGKDGAYVNGFELKGSQGSLELVNGFNIDMSKSCVIEDKSVGVQGAMEMVSKIILQVKPVVACL